MPRTPGSIEPPSISTEFCLILTCGTRPRFRAWATFAGALSSAALSDAGYTGHVAIEVEDRAFEGSLESRLDSLVIGHRYLLQFCSG